MPQRPYNFCTPKKILSGRARINRYLNTIDDPTHCCLPHQNRNNRLISYGNSFFHLFSPCLFSLHFSFGEFNYSRLNQLFVKFFLIYVSSSYYLFHRLKILTNNAKWYFINGAASYQINHSNSINTPITIISGEALNPIYG